MSKENQKEKDGKRRDNLSKYLYDLSKMTLTATVLSTIPSFMDEEFIMSWRNSICVLVGLSLTVIFAAAGNKIMKY